MEYSNLNRSLPEVDALDQPYRVHFSALPPIPDDGFSQRVLASLPSTRRQTVQRRLFCGIGSAVGIAVAIAGLSNSGNLTSLTTLNQELTVALAHLSNAPTAIALGVTLLPVWYASRGKWRLLPRL